MTETAIYNYLETTSDELRKLAKQGVESIKEYLSNDGKVTVESVWEIADSLVPVYNADLLEIAMQDLHMGYKSEDNADLEFEDVYSLIAREIFSALYSALYQWCEANLKPEQWEN